MSMSPADMERTVRQHGEDLAAVYDLLGSIQANQTRHGNRLHELASQLTEQERRFEVLDGKLDQILELLRQDRSAD
jgi:hypothetical protein